MSHTADPHRPGAGTLVQRRAFLAAAAAAGLVPTAWSGRADAAASRSTLQPGGGDAHRGSCLIGSGNALRAHDRAMELVAAGSPLIDAIVEGVAIIEDDPTDMSVGYGGLPNEEGVVQLDASVMDGRLHRAGSVGALERVKNPARVALQVMRRTDHVMLVGEGALRFARALGFPEQDLLTDQARDAWLRWKANLGTGDDWLNDEEKESPAGRAALPVPFTHGTIHVSGVVDGQVAACTSTSGLSWKLPGRVGDSPIIGAGMYCDAAVGSAGATGRGEAVIQVCGAFSIVQHMESGLTPTEACLAVLKRLADRTREKRLLDGKGRPNFGVSVYAVRRDGAFGSAALRRGSTFAVHTGGRSRVLEAAWLFED